MLKKLSASLLITVLIAAAESMSIEEFKANCTSLSVSPIHTALVNNNQTCVSINVTINSFIYDQMSAECASLTQLPNAQLLTPADYEILDAIADMPLGLTFITWLGVRQPDSELALDVGWEFISGASGAKSNATEAFATHFAGILSFHELPPVLDQCMYLSVSDTNGVKSMADYNCDGPLNMNVACEYHLTCADQPCNATQLCKTTDPFRGHFICEPLPFITLYDLTVNRSIQAPPNRFLRRALNQQGNSMVAHSEQGVRDYLICVKLCAANTGCAAFSYNQQTELCQLHKVKLDELHPIEEQGYVIVDKIEL